LKNQSAGVGPYAAIDGNVLDEELLDELLASLSIGNRGSLAGQRHFRWSYKHEASASEWVASITHSLALRACIAVDTRVALPN